MNHHEQRIARVIGLPLASAAIVATAGFGAPVVQAVAFSALPEFTATQSAQAADDTDVHVDFAYEAPVFPPGRPGTARTGAAIALPGRPHGGGAAPTLISMGVDLSVPSWLAHAVRDAPL